MKFTAVVVGYVIFFFATNVFVTALSVSSDLALVTYLMHKDPNHIYDGVVRIITVSFLTLSSGGAFAIRTAVCLAWSHGKQTLTSVAFLCNLAAFVSAVFCTECTITPGETVCHYAACMFVFLSSSAYFIIILSFSLQQTKWLALTAALCVFYACMGVVVFETNTDGMT
eukprot:3934967-Rhodomonas_salina.1